MVPCGLERVSVPFHGDLRGLPGGFRYVITRLRGFQMVFRGALGCGCEFLESFRGVGMFPSDSVTTSGSFGHV